MSTKVWACTNENIYIKINIMPGNQTVKAEECIVVRNDEIWYLAYNH